MCTFRFRIYIFFFIIGLPVSGQSLENLGIIRDNGASAVSLLLDDSTMFSLNAPKPLFSFRLDGVYFESDDVPAGLTGSRFIQIYPGGAESGYTPRGGSHPGFLAELVFRNNWSDTITISDVVPFGEGGNSAFITGSGPRNLARANLFLPGKSPVRVILPDNAWEMGFAVFEAGDGLSVSAIARRDRTDRGTMRRYETILPPGASVTYKIWADLFRGTWQEGMRLMFAERYLYDLSSFDDTLYRRDDLKWIRNSYLMILQMAWDREFYDRFEGGSAFSDFLAEYNRLFGHVDVYGIWPTWPRLGLDERNQWDLYRNLPGGTEGLRRISRQAKADGSRFFIAYNPWDKSTREEDHLRGLAEIIAATDADGVVLDTEGSSSAELQNSADTVRRGVVMYSEGMPVIKDMPGIVAARVHNALFFSPELNLNKLIRPDFAIFRVADVGEDILHREIAVAFFNGYGTELNMFRPGGRGEEYRADLAYLSRTTYLLRRNSDAFLDTAWTPLIKSAADRVYVNRWTAGDKTVFTVLNMDHRGYSGPLFMAGDTTGRHLVSLWRHEEINPLPINGELMAQVQTSGWSQYYNDTRREGSIDCIALLPSLIKAEVRGNKLHLAVAAEGTLLVSRGAAGYAGEPVKIAAPVDMTMAVDELFGIEGEKIVIELIDNEGYLLDERVVRPEKGRPWLVSETIRTAPASDIPEGMALVPAATITYVLNVSDDFVPHPSAGRELTIATDSFLIDRYPVTNAEFLRFIRETRYIPADTANYLRHWVRGMPVSGQERYPVVHVSLEDARAYASWAGKRLPTEAEWQLAAQGTDGREWPWGSEFHATKCNNGFGRPTPVDAFPKGESPYGVADLVGNVWQMTGDVYSNGAYYFNIIRGGSWFRPESSWWYVQGGPQPLTMTQLQLLVSPGYDRSATVGFRCVMDL
ncbi:MAG: formylglycine-generating enzyme family protein [Bacteroidales bacterium]